MVAGTTRRISTNSRLRERHEAADPLACSQAGQPGGQGLPLGWCERFRNAGCRCSSKHESSAHSSRIHQSLAFVARDQGQWERAESYFNEAERLDPRNVNLLTRHAQFYIALRRFPEALRKLDQILEILPNDIDALVEKAAIAQAEGDLPRAATLLAQVQPAAGDPTAWEQIAYQAILKRRPAQIIPRLKEL